MINHNKMTKEAEELSEKLAGSDQKFLPLTKLAGELST